MIFFSGFRCTGASNSRKRSGLGQVCPVVGVVRHCRYSESPCFQALVGLSIGDYRFEPHHRVERGLFRRQEESDWRTPLNPFSVYEERVVFSISSLKTILADASRQIPPNVLRKRFEMARKSDLCHSCECRNPGGRPWPWIPAFAGMTDFNSSFPSLNQQSNCLASSE